LRPRAVRLPQTPVLIFFGWCRKDVEWARASPPTGWTLGRPDRLSGQAVSSFSRVFGGARGAAPAWRRSFRRGLFSRQAVLPIGQLDVERARRARGLGRRAWLALSPRDFAGRLGPCWSAGPGLGVVDQGRSAARGVGANEQAANPSPGGPRSTRLPAGGKLEADRRAGDGAGGAGQPCVATAYLATTTEQKSWTRRQKRRWGQEPAGTPRRVTRWLARPGGCGATVGAGPPDHAGWSHHHGQQNRALVLAA